MEDSPKSIFLIILIIPLLLIYVYFFNKKDETKPIVQTPTQSETKASDVFDNKKYRDVLALKDYEITQTTKSYSYGSTPKDKPQATASKKMYVNNGILAASTLNIDNSVLVVYPGDKQRIYIFAKDKTYYSTDRDQYGSDLLTIEEENPILTSFNEMLKHTDLTKIKNAYEYKDFIKPSTETTEEQKASPDYKTVYGQKMVFRYEFDKNNLLTKYTILSNDRRYTIGIVTYTYKETTQEKIDSITKIPEGYKEVKE